MQLYSNKCTEAGGVKRPEPTHLRSGDTCMLCQICRIHG